MSVARRRFAPAALLLAAGACASGEAGPPRPLAAALDTTRGADSAVVVVTGLSTGELAAWRARPAGAPEWGRGLALSVAGSESVAVAARYAVSDTALELRPMFPLDPGRAYVVRLDPAALAPTRGATPGAAPLRTTLALPARAIGERTRVVRVLPSAEIVPENLLRLYIEFSAPMSHDPALDRVRLLDARGREVPAAFLPLDGNFWSPDRRRYTLFLDPGRVKTGILPNEQMGRPLIAGRRYTLRIDSAWRDGRGAPLAAPFEHPLRAGPPELEPIRLATWRVEAPTAGSRDPLVVRFPRPLDHGLLGRALGVEGAAGASMEGTVEIAPGERAWRFTPSRAWTAGTHRLVVLSILEDVAGNRVNRRFEADRFDRVDSTAVVPRLEVPFTVK